MPASPWCFRRTDNHTFHQEKLWHWNVECKDYVPSRENSSDSSRYEKLQLGLAIRNQWGKTDTSWSEKANERRDAAIFRAWRAKCSTNWRYCSHAIQIGTEGTDGMGSPWANIHYTIIQNNEREDKHEQNPVLCAKQWQFVTYCHWYLFITLAVLSLMLWLQFVCLWPSRLEPRQKHWKWRDGSVWIPTTFPCDHSLSFFQCLYMSFYILKVA